MYNIYDQIRGEGAWGSTSICFCDGDESNGYPKPMDPKDVEARIVGKADQHGRTVLPAEEYCEEDDVYDELYPAPASHDLKPQVSPAV